jgi:hypothetical protein
MANQVKKATTLEEAIGKVVSEIGERMPLKAFDKVKKTSVAARCREAGISLGELAESLGYDDAASFLKQQLNVDIKTLRLEELWTSDELHGMQPELFLDTILMANLNAMVTHNFVTEIPIDRGEVVIRTFEDGGQVYEIGQGETIKDDQGVIIRRTHYVKKIGRGLNWSYEEERRTAFPLIQLNLMRIGLRMALKKDLDVLNVLRTGIPAQLANGLQPSQAAINTPVTVSQSNTVGSGVPAGQVVFADIVNLVTDVANRNYHADFGVMSPVTYGKFALIPQVSNYLNAGPMATKVLETGVISHFFGLDLFITKQMPDNEILAGQKGFAGVIFIEQPLLLEEEKVISKQIERCQVTECYIPAVLYTQALTRLPF